MRKMEYAGFVYAIGAAIVWGLAYAVDQKVLAEISPMTFLFIASIVTAIVMAPWAFFEYAALTDVWSSGHSNLMLVLASVGLTVLANFLILSSIKALGASTAALLEIAYPLFVVLASFFIFGTTPSAWALLGGALIFSGSAIIIKFS